MLRRKFEKILMVTGEKIKYCIGDEGPHEPYEKSWTLTLVFSFNDYI